MSNYAMFAEYMNRKLARNKKRHEEERKRFDQFTASILLGSKLIEDYRKENEKTEDMFNYAEHSNLIYHAKTDKFYGEKNGEYFILDNNAVKALSQPSMQHISIEDFVFETKYEDILKEKDLVVTTVKDGVETSETTTEPYMETVKTTNVRNTYNPNNPTIKDDVKMEIGGTLSLVNKYEAALVEIYGEDAENYIINTAKAAGGPQLVIDPDDENNTLPRYAEGTPKWIQTIKNWWPGSKAKKWIWDKPMKALFGDRKGLQHGLLGANPLSTVLTIGSMVGGAKKKAEQSRAQIAATEEAIAGLSGMIGGIQGQASETLDTVEADIEGKRTAASYQAGEEFSNLSKSLDELTKTSKGLKTGDIEQLRTTGAENLGDLIKMQREQLDLASKGAIASATKQFDEEQRGISMQMEEWESMIEELQKSDHWKENLWG